MIQFIHVSAKFEKKLNALKKSEKMAVAAARKADEIIAGLKNNTASRIVESGKLSRHGECRIRNSVKYDLGKGYRMVGVKEKEHLFLLYVGTHDDCSAWIENNRNFSPDTAGKNNTTYRIKAEEQSPAGECGNPSDEPDYDELLMKKISDRELQYIFRGLTGAST